MCVRVSVSVSACGVCVCEFFCAEAQIYTLSHTCTSFGHHFAIHECLRTAADSQEHTRPFLDAQNKVQAHLTANGIVCQTCVPSVHGNEIEFLELPRKDGTALVHGVRLLRYIPGTLMCKVKEQSTALLEDLGRFMAQVDTCLEQ